MTLDERTKELIAVGASITANCQPCLEYHVTEALKRGASEEEIREAVGVGQRVRKGAASKMDEFASGLKHTAPAAPGRSKDACGCGSESPG